MKATIPYTECTVEFFEKIMVEAKKEYLTPPVFIRKVLRDYFKMKKQQSYTITPEVIEMLKIYSFSKSWTTSFTVDRILRDFLEVAVEKREPKKELPAVEYVERPEDIEASNRFLEKGKKRDDYYEGKGYTDNKPKTKEDLEFEKSLKESFESSESTPSSE